MIFTVATCLLFVDRLWFLSTRQLDGKHYKSGFYGGILLKRINTRKYMLAKNAIIRTQIFELVALMFSSRGVDFIWYCGVVQYQGF